MTRKEQDAQLRAEQAELVREANERLASLELAQKREQSRLKGQATRAFNKAMKRYNEGKRKTMPKRTHKNYRTQEALPSTAYQIAMNDIKNLGLSGNRFSIEDIKGKRAVNQQLNKIEKFLQSKSSKPEWIIESNKQRLKTMKDRYNVKSKADMNTIYKIFKSESWKLLTETMPSAVVLDTITTAMKKNENITLRAIDRGLKKALQADNDFPMDVLEDYLDNI